MDIDPAKLEIYRYVQKQYDTLIDARQGMKARLSIFLVVIGFLVTIAFTFAMPSLTTSIERALSLKESDRVGAGLVAILPLPAILFWLGYLTFALWAVIHAVSHVRLNTIGCDENTIKAAMSAGSLDSDHVIQSLTRNYLVAIRENEEDNYTVGTRYALVVKRVRRAVIATAVFVVLTLIARLTLYYVYGVPVAAPAIGGKMTSPNEPASNPAVSPSQVTPAPDGGAATPAQPTADPAKPNLDMRPMIITASPKDTPDTK